jgi:hypothetical protein
MNEVSVSHVSGDRAMDRSRVVEPMDKHAEIARGPTAGLPEFSERVLADDICRALLLIDWKRSGRAHRRARLRQLYWNHVAAIYGAGDVRLSELARLFCTDEPTIRRWLGPYMLVNANESGSRSIERAGSRTQPT